jgi:dipeptidyl-peptidase-4
MKRLYLINNRTSIFAILSFIFLNSPQLFSQITEETYHKAEYFLSNSIQREVYHLEVIPNWLDSKTSFWYQTFTKDGKRFYHTDIEKGITLEAFNHHKLA